MSACLATGIRGASVEGSTYDVTLTLGGTSGAQGMPCSSLLGGNLIQKNVLFAYLMCTDQPVLCGLSMTGRMRHTRWSIGMWQVDSRCDGSWLYEPTLGRITFDGMKFGSADVHRLQEHQLATEPI